MTDKQRHAHFSEAVEDGGGDDADQSEKQHEEEAMEFKKKQRRRSSVAKLPKSLAGLPAISTRRVSVVSTESGCKSA